MVEYLLFYSGYLYVWDSEIGLMLLHAHYMASSEFIEHKIMLPLTSNISDTLGGNRLVDHSDGALPVSAASRTSSFSI